LPSPPLVPFDRIPDDLARIYADAAREIDTRVGTALARGAVGTAAYRERQLNAINTTLARLTAATPPAARTAAQASYQFAALAVDTALPGGDQVRGRFNGVDVRTVEAIARNMERSLQGAVDGLGTSVAHVFEIADRLDGALPAARGELGSFLGRRVNDDARRAALETIAQAVTQGSTRRDASRALRARLDAIVRSGVDVDGALQVVKDSLTGEARASFIDRAGRRWDMPTYTRMVARTTTREAATRGTIERLLAHGEDLVTISAHGTTTPLCQAYEGRTFSLTGSTPGHPRLDRLTPFHPNCRHFMRPAGGDFEAFERELGVTGERPAPKPAPEKAAIERYQGVAARAINTALRPGPIQDIAKETVESVQLKGTTLDAFTAELDAAIAKGKAWPGGPVYRGVESLDELFPAGNRTATEHAYLSTTTDLDVAKRFGEVLELEMPPGARHLDMSDFHRSDESELLFGRGYRLERTGERTVDGQRITTVRVTHEDLPAAPPVAKMTPRQAEALKAWNALPEGDRNYRAVAAQLGVTEGRARVYVRQARHALEGTTAKRRRPGDAVKLLDPPRPPAPPFSENAIPHITEITDEGLEAQRIEALLAGDPGPEAGAVAAWEDMLALEDRAARRNLDLVLGEENVKLIDSAWGKRLKIRKQLLEGDMTVEHAERLAEEEWNRLEQIRETKEAERERHERYNTRSVNCSVCGRFKRKPADICDYCGNTPVGGVNYAGGLSDGGDFQDRQRAYNLAHGYEA
jgi:hypothetical protein